MQDCFATVTARDLAGATAGLQALADGRSDEGVAGPHHDVRRTGTVFAYWGQGSQWAGMGHRLLSDEPAFAASIDRLEPDFVDQAGFSLRALLAEGGAVRGDAQVQPVIIGLQLALTALWRAEGVEPDAVIGHSMGEVTAAVVADALSARECRGPPRGLSDVSRILCGRAANEGHSDPNGSLPVKPWTPAELWANHRCIVSST